MKPVTLPAALGTPLLQARFKSRPEDFVVTEDLGFDCSGDGEHLWLLIRKTGLSTTELAGRLARATGLRAADISWSGMKDKQGVCTQWFSLHSPGKEVTGLQQLESDVIQIVARERNNRKLRRGSHRGNEFLIRLRDVDLRSAGTDLQQALVDLELRIKTIRQSGVPNYFGEQRFGRANLADAEAWFGGGTADGAQRKEQKGSRPDRQQRSMLLSAARSAIFNAVLARRVEDGNWCRYIPGDVMNLDGSGSVFVPDSWDDTLQGRLDSLDIHLTGPMWGRGETRSTGEAGQLEASVAAQFPAFCDGLQRHGLNQERRSLRLPVQALDCRHLGEGTLEISFKLPAGGYATAVLHELCYYPGAL